MAEGKAKPPWRVRTCQKDAKGQPRNAPPGAVCTRGTEWVKGASLPLCLTLKLNQPFGFPAPPRPPSRPGLILSSRLSPESQRQRRPGRGRHTARV